MNRLALFLVKRLPIGAFLFALSIAGASAQNAGAQLARQVADGRPWAITMVPEKRKATVTFNADGTSTLEGGPMPMSPTWRATADGLCLKPGMVAPERCVALRREGAAIVGVRDGVVQFRLER